MNFSNIAFIDCYLSDICLLCCIKAIRDHLHMLICFPCSVVLGSKNYPYFLWDKNYSSNRGAKITPTKIGVIFTPLSRE